MELKDKSLEELKDLLKSHESKMMNSEMSDNFYYTNGRRYRDLKIKQEIFLEIKKRESEQS